MGSNRHSTHGTPHAPLARDVTRPSALLMDRAAPLHPLAPWLRPLLIVVGTAAALAVLLAGRPW